MQLSKLTALALLAPALACLGSGCGASVDGAASRASVAAVDKLPAQPEAEGNPETKPEAPQASEAASADRQPRERAPAPAARPAFQFANRKAAQKDLTFDDIKFPMEKTEPFERSMLTEKIEALEGQTIRIRGYMLPSFQQTGITRFVLVRDNMECCFGPGAALYDCIVVEMGEGKSTDFSVRPISVQGVFRIKPFLGPDGKHLAIYHLDGQSVGS
jgi:hypothetical protein